MVQDVKQVGEFDRLRLPPSDRLPGRYVYVPTKWIGDAPAFWRWCPDDPSSVEISCFRLSLSGEVQIKTFTVPSWFNDDAAFEQWCLNPDADPEPEALNAIGFALSFAWRVEGIDDWHLFCPGVNLQLAKHYFERSASKGYWAAINNLGVMYRDGLGVETDAEKAFRLFHRAAQDLDPISLRHLAECYRDGIGCECDPEVASFLEELIRIVEDERREPK